MSWFDVFRVIRPSPPWGRPVAQRFVARQVVPLFSRDFPVFSPVLHDPRLVPASRPETACTQMVRSGMQDWPHQNGEAITRVVITEVVSTKTPQNPNKSPPGSAWGHPDPDVWPTGSAARPPVSFTRFPVSQTPFPAPPDPPLRAPPPCSRTPHGPLCPTVTLCPPSSALSNFLVCLFSSEFSLGLECQPFTTLPGNLAELRTCQSPFCHVFHHMLSSSVIMFVIIYGNHSFRFPI